MSIRHDTPANIDPLWFIIDKCKVVEHYLTYRLLQWPQEHRTTTTAANIIKKLNEKLSRWMAIINTKLMPSYREEHCIPLLIDFHLRYCENLSKLWRNKGTCSKI